MSILDHHFILPTPELAHMAKLGTVAVLKIDLG